tara:strand:- start:19588 stop:19926 length:339 start_codon:yes stop_codon:yes gene_type:complete
MAFTMLYVNIHHRFGSFRPLTKPAQSKALTVGSRLMSVILLVILWLLGVVLFVNAMYYLLGLFRFLVLNFFYPPKLKLVGYLFFPIKTGYSLLFSSKKTYASTPKANPITGF